MITTTDTERDEVRPLIFNRLSVDWAELTLPQPYPRPPVEGEGLRSFAMPGVLTPRSMGDIMVTPTGLKFPTYGIFAIAGHFGTAKILLVDPTHSDDDCIVALSSFVVASSWHSGADTSLGYHNDMKDRVYPGAWLKKLFYSDQPLALWCGQISDLLGYLLHLRGYSCRKVGLTNHLFLEAYLPHAAKWAIIDPDFGVMLRHNGALLSVAEVIALRSTGRLDAIELVPLAAKAEPRGDTNMPLSFSGQLTWEPQFASPRPMASTPYYHEVVLQQGFERVSYYSYTFDHTADTRIRPSMSNGMPLAAPP